MKLDHCRDTGYRYASAPEGDPNAICPAFQRVFCHHMLLLFLLHANQILIKKLPISTHHSVWLSFLFQLDHHFLSSVPFYHCH